MSIKQIKVSIIVITAIIAVFTLAYVGFYFAAHQKTEIYAVSYDGSVKFVLGKVSADYCSVDPSSGDSFSKVQNNEALLAKASESDLLYGNYSTIASGKLSGGYVLLYDGYYFGVREDNEGLIRIENLVSVISDGEVEYLFPFPQTGVRALSGQSNYYTWAEIGLVDSSDFMRFCSGINKSLCEYAGSAVYIRCYRSGDQPGFASSLYVELRPDASGVFVGLVERFGEFRR